jgi:hypothetical protein
MAKFKEKPWYQKMFLWWTHDGAHHVSEGVIYDWNFEPLVVMPIVLIVLIIIAGAVDPGAVEGTLAFVVALSPIWLPIYLGKFFWTTWIHYIRFAFWFSQEHVLLEVQLPPEVEKSPLAMELFLTGIYNTGGEGTFIARLWEGKFRPIFSLEVASNEGQIKFYIHCRKGWKNILEAKLYGQYPEAKVTEIEDYVARIPFNTGEYGLWGTEFAKTERANGEPADAVPIKTYIDYKLDKDPDKPETQVDPMTNMLEYMGQIGKGEYIWLQIVMQARKKDQWYGFYYEGNFFFKSRDSYKTAAKDKIAEITKGAVERAQNLIDTGDEGENKKQKAQAASRGQMLLSPGERLQIEAIERALTKSVFECGIRGLYFAKKENFNGVNIGNLVMLFAAFRQPGYNNIMPGRGMDWFDYPWQDWGDIRQNKMRDNLFFRYKQRAYFYVPYDQVPVAMTTEELATIWHFPGSSVQTPAIDRVPSRRSEAPINLPV